MLTTSSPSSHAPRFPSAPPKAKPPASKSIAETNRARNARWFLAVKFFGVTTRGISLDEGIPLRTIQLGIAAAKLYGEAGLIPL